MGVGARVSGHVLALLLLSSSWALAQYPSPEIASVFPPGGSAGSTVEVELTGTDLDDLSGLRFSHPGITAQPVLLPADEIWPELRPDGLKFSVRIDSRVPAGFHEVRTLGRFGISVPRPFVVSPGGGHPEWTSSGGNETPATATEIHLDQGVNGRVVANRSSCFKIAARRGQRILVHLWGERIDSRIDATLTVLDPSGSRLSESRNEFGLDPLGDFTAASDGFHVIEVSDRLYNGGPTYFFRLMATAAPHLDGVFPPAGKAGDRTRFTVYGRNLPGGKPSPFLTASGARLETKEVVIPVPSKGEPAPVNGSKAWEWMTEAFTWREGSSGPVRIGIARDDVVIEASGAAEQPVHPPCEIAGRFDEGGDLDRYRFTAKKGEILAIEVVSARAGVPVDPVILVEQIGTPAGEENGPTVKFLAESDDIQMNSLALPGGFDTLSRDSDLLFTAPEDGTYRLTVSSHLSHSGALSTYRLGIRPPRPGFDLIAVADRNWQEGRNAVPGVPRINAGGTMSIRVLALRRDGFAGPVELAVRSPLPPGVIAPPVSIWEGNDEGYLVITAASKAQDWTGDLEITGTGSIGGQPVTVPAHFGTLVWSAIDTTRERVRSRIMERFPLTVTAEPRQLALEPTATKVWEAEMRKVLDLPVTITKGADVKGAVTVTPYGLPGFKRPASLAISSGNQGVLKINFNPDGNNRPFAGQGRFVLKVDGVVGKYRTNPEAAERWTRWQKAVDAATARITTEKSRADAGVSAANSALSAADKAITDHATTRNGLAKVAADALAKRDVARRERDGLEAALKGAVEWLPALQSAQGAHAAARPTLEKSALEARAKAETSKKVASDAGNAITAADQGHAASLATLEQSLAAAEGARQAALAALATAEKALADHFAARLPLANPAAATEIRARVAKRDSGLATSALEQAVATHEVKRKALAEAIGKTAAALKAPETALGSANNAVTAKEATRDASAKAAADARTKLEGARKVIVTVTAAVDAATSAHATRIKGLSDAAAIREAEQAHRTGLAKLTAEKSKAEADARTAESALAAATKAVNDAESALGPLRKTQAEALAKVETAKKSADEAAAALPEQEKNHATEIARLTPAKEAASKAAEAAGTAFTAAAKPLADHDAGRGALEPPVATARTKIESAQKAVAEAQARIDAARAAQVPVMAKLVVAKRTADLAAAVAGAAALSAMANLEAHPVRAAELAKALEEAGKATGASGTATPQKIADWNRVNAACSAAEVALAKARESVAANEAAQPILHEAAVFAKEQAERAKAEVARLTELLARATAAKTLAAAEARKAQDRAKDKDVKFTVFSEPIDLRITDPSAPR